ncbi:MAG: hypothetical protein ACO274_09360, partial [Vulcanococcus sp.]
NNLVIPEDKLPKPVVVQQQQTYTYVCRDPAGTGGIIYKPGVPDTSTATRYTTTNPSSTPECTNPFTEAEIL